MSEPVCPYCGRTHRQSARFCPVTGKLIQPAEQPPVTPAPSQDASADQRDVAGLTGRLPANYTLNGHYLILRKIGQGGMAAVYQAVDARQLGALWAIKEMSDAALATPHERQYAIHAFQQEANLLRRLNHPNLPKVVDAFTESFAGGDKHYLVMEFVPGQTLQTTLENRPGPFSEAEVLSWAMQLCDVLAYLHGQTPKIIFRDIKPSNIMLTPQGQIKLIDFGIARFFKPEKTKDTLALGTPGYAAPEAVSGQTDERSDVYSLCVTLHHLLTLHDPIRTMFCLPPPRQLNSLVSPEMESILMRGLQNSRGLRWASAYEMRAALSRLVRLPPAGQATALGRGQPAARTIASQPPPMVVQPRRESPAAGRFVDQPLSPSPARSSRPTTRLIVAAAQLSGRQLAALTAGALVLIVMLVVLFAPLLDDLPFDFNQVPIIAIFGALGYSAYPRRGVAFASHALLSTVMVATIWLTLGWSQGYQWIDLLVAALLSGAFMELWVSLLPLVKGGARNRDATGRREKREDDVWLREAGWMAVMAVFGTVLFFGLVTQWTTGFIPIQWFLSAVFGVLGWFLGDLIQQYLLYRRAGLR
ncbi:MAG: serine/threonine protein kinase [Anaerolineales bacterium]|nr:serine/threonine protein kinase [Anaerolineales bacterium]